MNIQRDALDAAQDVVEFAGDIADHISGVDRDSFFSCKMRQQAVMLCFIHIGEALNRLDRAAPEVTATLPEFRKVVGFRNILTHVYDSVDLEIVWNAAIVSAPELKRKMEALVPELESMSETAQESPNGPTESDFNPF